MNVYTLIFISDRTTFLSSTLRRRELFVINNDTPSDTHDTLRCTRCLKDEIREGDSDDEIDETKCVE